MTFYNTPFGTTASQKKYIDSWRSIAKPFEKFGFKLHSFDPGISLQIGCKIVNLPTEFAVKVGLELANNAIQKNANDNDGGNRISDA
jgi:hypothetical protein